MVYLQDMELGTTIEHPLLSMSCTVNDMHASLSSMEQLSWIDQTLEKQIKLCKISSQPSISTQPLVVTHSLLVNNDCTWKLFICGHEVKPSTNSLLKPIPITLNQTSFIKLFSNHC